MPVDRARFVAEQWAHEVEGGRIELRADPAHKVPNAILYRRAEATACWQAIQADVLLVMGDASDFGEAMADWQHPDPAERPFPGAGLVVIPDCGHMLHFEKPVELAQAVFLIAFPLSIVGAVSLSTSRLIQSNAPEGDALFAALNRHRLWTQIIGMISILVTSFWGMYQNISIGVLGG